jgi:uncharacterized Ntn-hydrolase superfamily protein
VAYGPEGLELLRDGHDPETVIDRLTQSDEEAATRQVGVVARDSSTAAFTGEECLDYAGHRQGDGYTVQGNILEGEATLDAMVDAYESTGGGLPERLIAALHAGNEAGGDSRGEQAAALYVVKPEGGYDGGNDRWVDVRVDDHDSPIDELERVFKLYDVTLLERAPPDEPRHLKDEAAVEVAEALEALGYLESAGEGFGEREREALEAFRGANNFENHDLPVLEDALVHGWADASEEDPQSRLIEALWSGLSRLDRT